MKKLFGKKKKDPKSPGSSPSGLTPSFSPEPPQSGSNGCGIEVLSVKPAYLNLKEFTLPARALPMFFTAQDEEILLDRCRRCSDDFVLYVHELYHQANRRHTPDR
jgi:hypothetical protein